MARKGGEKVKKVRRICVLLFFIIVFNFILIANETYAEDDILTRLTQSPDVNVKAEYYSQEQNLFCVNKGQYLNENQEQSITYYSTTDYIILDGMKAELHSVYGTEGNYNYNNGGYLIYTTENKKNAVLYYILLQDNLSSNKTVDYTGGYGNVKDDGAVSNAIWKYFHQWYHNEDINARFRYDNDMKSLNYILKTQEGHQFISTQAEDINEAGDNLIIEAELYANKMSNSGNQIKKVDSNNTNISSERIDNVYSRIGPFNWFFPGNMKEITSTSITIYGFENKNKEAINVNNIKSGEEFYIKIKSENIRKGLSITLKGKAEVQNARIRINFLVPNGNIYQNLIYRDKQNTTEITTIEGSFRYEIEPGEGKLQIRKTDANGISRDFIGIGFKIYSQVSGSTGYLKLENGEISYTSDFWSAKEWYTNSNGYTDVIEDLPVGNYKIYETKIPDSLRNIYALPNGWIEQGTVVIEGGKSVTPFTATNTQAFGRFKIMKKDKNNIARDFSDIGFKIKNSNDEWLIIDSNGDVTGTTTNEQNATLLKLLRYTEKRFVAETKVINKVPLGTYTIYERSLGSLGNIYKIDDTNSVTVTINSNNASEVLEVGPYINPQVYSDFRILKIDKHTKKPIAGIGFKIYSKAEKKWVVYNNGKVTYSSYYDGTNGATVFHTGADGLTPVIKSLPLGFYDIYETELGTYGDIYKLDNINVPGKTEKVDATKIKEDYEVVASENGMVTVTHKNIQEYVKLSGHVWLDKETTKKVARNDLYKYDSTDDNDESLEGIKVKLQYNNGKEIITEQETTTDKYGNYKFEHVTILKLPNYFIEFEYNGLAYQNVVPYDKIKDKKYTLAQRELKGSKAIEKDDTRTAFNNNFSTVEGRDDGTNNKGYTTDEDGNRKYSLMYTIANHKATLKNLYNNNYYKMQADTKTAGFSIGSKFPAGSYGSPTTPKVTEIININLGLYEREQPDIAIVQDIQNVFVRINGHEHRYDYDYRFADIEPNEDRYEVSVKDKYYRTYIRVMYQADRKFENGGVNELEAYITYKITIRNQATTLTTVINGLDYYFDSNYEIAGNNNSEIVGIGSELDGYDNISNLNNDMQFETVSNYGSGRRYKKTKINNENGIIVEAGKEKSIFIKFKLNRTALINIINNDENLDSVAEIHSYSVKSGGKAYAGIDKDSNPNNCIPTQTDDFEDDTDWAPGLKIKLEEKRTTSGTVFLDTTNSSIMSGAIRNGDGKFNSSTEKGIKGVDVTMYESDGTVAKIYDEVNEVWKEAKTTTDENGNYTIGGYIPGEYYIVYTWGDKTYKVQDYKGTIQDADEDIETLKPNNKEWYKTKTPRYSDAQDDWYLRLRIDNQTKIMTNDNKEAINSYGEGKQLSEVDSGASKDLITKMQSTTPVFRVNLEYNTETTKNADEYELNEDGSIKLNGIYVVKKEKYRNEIQNIDFGIAERAKQKLQLEKNIKSVKVTLTDVSVLVNAEINDDGTIENKPKYVTYVRKSDSAEALFKLEVDQEIIQNAKLEVEYELNVTNISEVDYNNMDYYLYGKVPPSEQYKMNQVVNLKPEQIIDYLDNNLVSDDSNENWEEIQTADGITALGLSEEASENAKTSLRNGIVKVLKNKFNGDGLRPMSGYNNCSIILKCNKLLTVKDEEIPENHAEIIRVRKNFGATLQTTPGNYIPNKSVLKADNKTYYNPTSEEDNSNSGSIQIIPPTGLNKDIIAFTLLAISSLGILTTGIILIKKYVL